MNVTILIRHNNAYEEEVSLSEHRKLKHSPIGFCECCKRNFYVPHAIHYYYQCTNFERYLGNLLTKDDIVVIP